MLAEFAFLGMCRYVLEVSPPFIHPHHTPRGHTMPHKPRSTLCAILGCTAALSVPLVVLLVGNPSIRLVALHYVPIVVGGCVGYSVKGWRGLWIGAGLAALATLVIGVPASALWLWFDAS